MYSAVQFVCNSLFVFFRFLFTIHNSVHCFLRIKITMTDSRLQNKSKPVDDIEDEEEDREGDEEELVNPETKREPMMIMMIIMIMMMALKFNLNANTDDIKEELVNPASC